VPLGAQYLVVFLGYEDLFQCLLSPAPLAVHGHRVNEVLWDEIDYLE